MPEEPRNDPEQPKASEEHLTDAEMDTVAGGIVIIGDTAGITGKGGTGKSGSSGSPDRRR